MEKEFPDQAEVIAFVSSVAPLLVLAMELRRQPLSDDQFYQRAIKVTTDIKSLMESPARHMAIKSIQNIFI